MANVNKKGAYVMELKMFKLALRFILEIVILFIVGYWGYRIGEGTVAKIGFAIVFPTVIALFWGLFGSPNAPYLLTGVLHVLLEIVVFGSAVAALYFMGQGGFALLFAVILLVNRLLMFLWGQ